MSRRSAPQGLRLRHRNAGAQASHHLDPVIMFVDVALADDPARFALRVQHKIGVHRDVEIRHPPRIDAEKSRRRDSDRRERNIVDEHRLPDRVCDIAEPSLREGVAEHHHLQRSGTIVVAANQTSRCRRQRQPAKEVSRYVSPLTTSASSLIITLIFGPRKREHH